MKFPKNKELVFYVQREDGVVVGIFAALDDADDYAGACAQSWAETTGYSVEFHVRTTSFYG